MLEHAFYADQHAAVDLLERIVHDDAGQREFAYRLDETITGARYLLDAPAGAASDHFWLTLSALMFVVISFDEERPQS